MRDCSAPARHGKMRSVDGGGTGRWTSCVAPASPVSAVLFVLGQVLVLLAFCSQSADAQAPTLDFATSTPAGTVTVTQDTSSFLACSFSSISTGGTPIVTFAWTGDPGPHQVIRTSNTSGSIALQTAVLLLQRPTQRSSGQYVCTARNSVGPSSISWYLNVLDPGSPRAPVATTSAVTLRYENSTTSPSSNNTNDTPTTLQFTEGTTVLTALATFDAIAVALLLYILCCAPKRTDGVTGDDDDEKTAAAAENAAATGSASKSQSQEQSGIAGHKEQHRAHLELTETRAGQDIRVARSISLPADRTQTGLLHHWPRKSRGKKPGSPLTRRVSKHQQPPSASNDNPTAVPGMQGDERTHTQRIAWPEPREVDGHVVGNPSASNAGSGAFIAQGLGGESVVRMNPLFASEVELQITPTAGNTEATPSRQATPLSPLDTSIPFTSAASAALGRQLSASASHDSIASTVTSNLSPQENDVFFTVAKDMYYTMPSYRSQVDVASLNELQDVREWASHDATDSRGSRQQRAKSLTPHGRRTSTLSLPVGRPAGSAEGLSRVLQNLP